MLDHVFTDAIGALRDALETAMLERSSAEERFTVDVLLGDTAWETSYELPGEGVPPRVRADISLEWPTWSQSAFRSWLRHDEPDEDPRIVITAVLRLQGLAEVPDPASVVGAVPFDGPPLGSSGSASRLQRGAPTVETSFSEDLRPLWHAVEVPYEGSYVLDDAALSDGSILDGAFGAIGGWIASALVRIGDLPLRFHDSDS